MNRSSVSRKDSNPERFVSSVPNRSVSSNSKFGSRLCINNPDRNPERFVSSSGRGRNNARRNNNPGLNRKNRIEAGTINRIESSMTGKRGMYK